MSEVPLYHVSPILMVSHQLGERALVPSASVPISTRTELGHGLITVLEMAWVRQNGESSSINSVISKGVGRRGKGFVWTNRKTEIVKFALFRDSQICII